MSSEIIKLANLYNLNLGLVKDYHAMGLLTSKKQSWFGKTFAHIQYFYAFTFWFVGIFRSANSNRIPNKVFLYDIGSHLNGRPSGMPKLHISEITIAANISLVSYLAVAKNNRLFLLALSKDGYSISRINRFLILNFFSAQFGYDQLKYIEELNLGWDDNWRAGALIKSARECGIKTEVYQHGLVGNCIRYIPYSDVFCYFERNFNQLVANPLNVKLKYFEFKTKNEKLTYSSLGKRALFLSKIESSDFEKIPFTKYDIVIFHPLQNVPRGYRKMGIKLKDVNVLKLRGAKTMYSTVYYELKGSGIPTKIFQL